MAANISLLLQLLIQNQYQDPNLQNQIPISPLISDPNQKFSLTDNHNFDDGCDLNIFEEDTCANRWKSDYDQFKKIDTAIKSNSDHFRKIDKRTAIKCRRWLWPDRTVPYKVNLRDPMITEKFQAAIDELNDLQCVNFYRLIDDEEIDKLGKMRKKYLTIREVEPVPGRSCQASLGYVGRQPRMDLSHVCTKGQILHELMHILGFAHEHQRPDRDRYVKIRCEHLMPNVTQDFRRLREQVISQVSMEDEYDFRSIMHYRLDHFSIDGHQTIEPDLDYLKGLGIREDEIGLMRELSEGDVRRIRRLYEC